MSQTPDIRPLDWALIAVLGLTWGGTFLVTEIALTGITPFWLAACRISVAALAMFTIWRARGGALFHASPGPLTRLHLVMVGATATTLPFILIAWGQQYVTAGFAGVSMAAVALIVLPLAHVFVPAERMTPRRALGMLVGFVGVCLLLGGRAFETSGADLEVWGRLACLAGATCYAVSSVGMRRLPRLDAIGLAACMMAIGATLAIPAAWAIEGPPPLPDTRTILIVAGLGLIPTAAATFLQVLVVTNAGPVFMSLVNYQVPIWSMLLGAWLLHEPLPPSLLLALALILSGVALSQWGALRRLFGGRPNA